MVEPAAFRKPDRYKASSYHAYNGKMPSCYDTAIWSRGAASIDRAIIEKLGPPTRPLRILDVGRATGRLVDHLPKAGPRTSLLGTDVAPNSPRARGRTPSWIAAACTAAMRRRGRTFAAPAADHAVAKTAAPQLFHRSVKLNVRCVRRDTSLAAHE